MKKKNQLAEKKFRLSKMELMMSFIFIFGVSFSQPINNTCGTATEVFPSNSCVYSVATLSNATQSLPPNTCGVGTSSLAKDVWFSFIAPATTTTLTAKPASTGGNVFNLVLELYSSCGGSVVACADQFGNLQQETIEASGLVIGQTYFFRVYQYKTSISTLDPTNPTFSVCVVSNSVAPTVPSNNNCSSATALISHTTCANIISSIEGATESFSASVCNLNTSATANDVWFSFNAASVSTTISVTPDASTNGFDAVVELFSACGSSLIACENQHASNQNEVLTVNNLLVGQTYHARVYQFKSTVSTPNPVNSSFSICVTHNNPTVPVNPANDECLNAVSVTSNTTCITSVHSLTNSTQSLPPNTCSSNLSATANDVWFSFNAASVSTTISVTPDASTNGFDAVVELFSACGSSLIACENQHASNQNEVLTVNNLVVGQTYHARVYQFKTTVSTPDPVNSSFSICVTHNNPTVPVNPANDECLNAVSVTSNTTCITSIHSLTNSTQSLPPNTCSSNLSSTANDVWFSFIAASPNTTITVSPSATSANIFNAVVELYSACGSVAIGCEDSFGNLQSEIIVKNNLVSGQTYYFRVYANLTSSLSAMPADPTFSVCVKHNSNIISSINDYANNNFSFYPNPTTNTINVINSSSSNFKISVFDMYGKKVLQTNFLKNETQLDVSKLDNGIYYIQIINENEKTISNHKFIKQ